MKRVEFKAFGIGSAAKATVYITLLGAAIIFAVGVFLMLAGAASSQDGMLWLGFGYAVMSVVIVPVYALIGALTALIYNALAKRFGGLATYVEENEDAQC